MTHRRVLLDLSTRVERAGRVGGGLVGQLGCGRLARHRGEPVERALVDLAGHRDLALGLEAAHRLGRDVAVVAGHVGVEPVDLGQPCLQVAHLVAGVAGSDQGRAGLERGLDRGLGPVGGLLGLLGLVGRRLFVREVADGTVHDGPDRHGAGVLGGTLPGKASGLAHPADAICETAQKRRDDGDDGGATGERHGGILVGSWCCDGVEY
jgi:hypothetical protein